MLDFIKLIVILLLDLSGSEYERMADSCNRSKQPLVWYKGEWGIID